MKRNKTITINYTQYDSIQELDGIKQRLIEKAKGACEQSYSPFSKFKVGAAILLDNGEILTASNQESEVLPSGMCAERILLYNAQSNHHNNKITDLAIFSISTENICPPCSSCRQIISDTIKRQEAPITIYMASDKEVIVVDNALELIPFNFSIK